MASLTLTIGQISESVSMPDAAALDLLTNYLRTLDVPDDATNQQKARLVLQSLGRHMQLQAARGVDNDENAQARSRATTRINALGQWVEV